MNDQNRYTGDPKKRECADGGNYYILRLFVTGASPNSVRAISNIKQLCETHIKGRYILEIIDVYQNEDVAETEQLVALPLLIKKCPFPERRLIGDMSDNKRVLRGLGIIQ